MDDALRAKTTARAFAARTPIAEKLRILEHLRERDRAIKRAVDAGPRRADHAATGIVGAAAARCLSPTV